MAWLLLLFALGTSLCCRGSGSSTRSAGFTQGERNHSDIDVPPPLRTLGIGEERRFTASVSAVEALRCEFYPASVDGAGTLNLELAVHHRGAWSVVGSTKLSQRDGGDITIPAGYLAAGANRIRLSLHAGSGSATRLSWDMIRCLPLRGKVLDSPASVLTSGLTITVPDDEPPRAMVLELSAASQQRPGVFEMVLEVGRGSAWQTLRSFSFGIAKPARIDIPAWAIYPGSNKFRIRVAEPGAPTFRWGKVLLAESPPVAACSTELLEDVVRTTLAYFLSDRIIHRSGLPLTAYKADDRARFGYSNPTEWGYALQAWIVAAELGVVTSEEAVLRINRQLKTLLALQEDPHQFREGLFYPYYTLTDSAGVDLPLPQATKDSRLPCGDTALLYASVYITKGWLRLRGSGSEEEAAAAVLEHINFAKCLRRSPKAAIAHTLDADTGELSVSSWAFYADEGGVVAFVAGPLSDSVPASAWKEVVNAQERHRGQWDNVTIAELAYFNMMFTWAQRPLAGMPLFTGAGSRLFGTYSWLPAIEAHWRWATRLGLDYPGFSAAMTQTHQQRALVAWTQQWFVPPNLANQAKRFGVAHTALHALFVPAAGIRHLSADVLRGYAQAWIAARADPSAIWHPAGTKDPFGFEVVGSPREGDQNYPGADDGRYIFETLSQAYIALSIYHGIATDSGHPTFAEMANANPGHALRLRAFFDHVYPDNALPADSRP